MTGNPTLMDSAAWLRAVAAAPEDDLPRLAYADWLDENGQGERAEFIRLQCRIAALQRDCCCGACVKRRGGGQHHNGPCAVDQERDGLPDGRSRQAFLRRRERELVTGPDGKLLSRSEWFPGIPADWLLKFDRDTGDYPGRVVVRVARGLPHRVTVPTVASLVGGPCPHCNTLDYMPLEDGGGGRICSRCGSTGRTPGLAATLGRLMGRWETCGRCKGEKEVAERMKGKDIGSGYDSVLVFKQCPDCKDHTGKSTGRRWVPGGVLGCCEVRVAVREPSCEGRASVADEFYPGPESYDWWEEGADNLDLPNRLAASIPTPLFQLMWDATRVEFRCQGGGADRWLEYPTPDLAREALGAAAKAFCVRATKDEPELRVIQTRRTTPGHG